MMINKRILKLVFVAIIILSCTKQNKNLTSEGEQSSTGTLDYVTQDIENSKITKFTFPDTIFINQKVTGKIKYNIELDTLDLSKIFKRYIFLYVSTETYETGVKAIEKVKHKIFIDSLGEGNFIFNASFKNKGNNIVNGVIQDVILYNVELENGKKLTSEEETIIMKKVYVKE